MTVAHQGIILLIMSLAIRVWRKIRHQARGEARCQVRRKIRHRVRCETMFGIRCIVMHKSRLQGTLRGRALKRNLRPLRAKVKAMAKAGESSSRG